MEKQDIFETAATRIAQMERDFDRVQSILRAEPARLWREADCRARVEKLREYYTGGQWLRDYELDEQGMLPPRLKRGVLSQDAMQDLLERIEKEKHD